jgi:hypothetical protein
MSSSPTEPDHSPSAERNKQPILEALKQRLPAAGSALEIASGTGQHVVWFARHLPGWTWQPTEVHRGALYNIEVRVAQAELDNVREAVQLDVAKTPWLKNAPDAAFFDLVLCINMLHIAPWEACPALMRGAAQHLSSVGLLATYGPYFERGTPPTQSNLEFDQSLRAHDPSWGIRQLDDVKQAAAQAGLELAERVAMPANNLLLFWKRSP